MSVEALAVALHHSRAEGTALVVLLGIANHAGDGGSWPTIATLAKYGRCSTRHAQRCVDQLQRMGELYVERQAGGTLGLPDHLRPNRYQLTLSCPPECDRTTNHRIVPRRYPQATQAELSVPGVPESDRVTPTSGGDTDVRGGGDTRVTQTVTVNPEYLGSVPTSPLRASDDDDADDELSTAAAAGIAACRAALATDLGEPVAELTEGTDDAPED